MSVCGIDPGASGAVARLDGKLLTIWPMPWVPNVGIQVVRLRVLLTGAEIAFVEEPQTRIGQGVSQALSMGIQFGRLLMLLETMGIPTERVPANRWKSAMGLVGKRAKRPKGAEKKPPKIVHPKGSPEAKAAAKSARDASKVRKQRSIAMAQAMFPGVSLLPTPGSEVPCDGMAEAALLAEYGRRKLAGQ